MKILLRLILVSTLINSMTIAQSDMWQSTGDGISLNPITELKADPFGNVFVVGRFQNLSLKLYKSSDDGLTWNSPTDRAASGLQNFDISQNGFLFLAQGSWIYRSTDHDMTWSLVTDLGGWSEAPCHFLSFDNPDLLFAQRYYQFRTNGPAGLFYSSDNGVSWNNCYSSGQYVTFLDIPLNSVGILSDSVVLASTTSTLYASANGPTHFHPLQNIPKVSIHSLFCSQSSHSVYMISDSGIFCSSDTGQTWNASNTGLSTSNVLALKVNSNGEYFACTDSGLFVSKNSGKLWSNIGLQQMTIYSILFNDSSTIIATGNQGIFYSTNEGGQWTDMNSGLPGDYKALLTINSDGYAFAVCNNTIYRTVSKVSQITSVANHGIIEVTFSLEQNYPNPFNPSTTIVYNLDQNEAVRLTVYDVLGNKVETLVDQMQPKGTHQVLFNGSNLGSGVYFYQFQAGHSLINRKMVLLK